MKNEFDDKLDQLLRRHAAAQRSRISSSQVSDSSAEHSASAISASAHLDANEVNAYLQSALPDASRQRLTAHLADCGMCRQSIALLSRTFFDDAHIAQKSLAEQADAQGEATHDDDLQNKVATVPASPVSSVSAWRERLAALFRVPAYAYALPAVALLITACVVTLIYNRTSQNGGNPIIVFTDTTQKPATSNPNYDLSHANGNNLSPNPNAPDGNADASRQANANAPETVASATVASVNDTGSNGDQQPNANSNQSSSVASQNNENVSPARSNEDNDRANSNNDRTPESARQSDAETSRAQVAGRRFSRQRGVWTDRAYTGAQQTFIVTRDSEQYRALVADQPLIGRIAEQLNGEVIVVIKDRAYRIR